MKQHRALSALACYSPVAAADAHGSPSTQQSQPNVTTTAPPPTTSASASTQRVSKKRNTRANACVRRFALRLLANHQLLRFVCSGRTGFPAPRSSRRAARRLPARTLGEGPPEQGRSGADASRQTTGSCQSHSRRRYTRANAVAESIQTVSLTLSERPPARSIGSIGRARADHRCVGLERRDASSSGALHC